jgi:competence protein ComEC
LQKPLADKPKMNITKTFDKFFNIFQAEKSNLWLWLPVLFGFGVAFYFSFAENFTANFVVFAVLFVAALVLFLLNYNSLRSLIFLACALFLLGGFYANFYENFFLNQTKISGKIYVDAIGKVESIKIFYNPINGVAGANLVIAKPSLYKAKFAEKKQKPHKKKKKKTKKKAKKTKIKKAKLESENQEGEIIKPKKPRKKRATKKVQEQIEGNSCIGAVDKCSSEIILNSEKKLEKKPKKKKAKKKKISQKNIQKNFVNLDGYQEIDREFLDYAKNYQQVQWLKIGEKEIFPNPPQKISVNLIKNFQDIAVNDIIAMRLMLQPPKAKEFLDNFDFALDAKAKKIGAYGFVLGSAKILKKADISNIDQWFLDIREKIRTKILQTLEGDNAAIALAFLIGDQSQISKDLNNKIRNSGLAHLLSISGFHLSLASAIFFVSLRMALSRSQYLALNFDLKKIAALMAIFATYFYLKIAASPVPAQRAFLMVLALLIAILLNQKINAKRAIMTAVLVLILVNPYSVFNVSFQLSFAAILVLISFHEGFSKKINFALSRRFWQRFFWYFLEIILLSILIQIATTPFLMHSFQNFAALGFVSNILAIPLSSFIIMPLGFLALFLMPLGLEKNILLLMGQSISLLKKIAISIANLDWANFTTPELSSLGLVLAILGLLLICLSEKKLILLGIFIFALSFASVFLAKKPDILFDDKQKFFALYDQENGLVFSKPLRPSKKRQLWMDKMGEKEFKFLGNSQIQQQIFCSQEKCLINKQQKILVLLTRNKIAEICQNNFDVIVNLTAKYQLPSCIASDKIKIDNSDFYRHGGHFFYFENGKIVIETTS